MTGTGHPPGISDSTPTPTVDEQDGRQRTRQPVPALTCSDGPPQYTGSPPAMSARIAGRVGVCECVPIRWNMSPVLTEQPAPVVGLPPTSIGAHRATCGGGHHRNWSATRGGCSLAWRNSSAVGAATAVRVPRPWNIRRAKRLWRSCGLPGRNAQIRSTVSEVGATPTRRNPYEAVHAPVSYPGFIDSPAAEASGPALTEGI